MSHDTPQSGRPLTEEDVALLKQGDLLLHEEHGLMHFDTEDLEDGALCWVYERGDPLAAADLTFIGRPDVDGWISWSGGVNPAPGVRVAIRTQAGDEFTSLSDNFGWGPRTDIIAFRLPTAEADRRAEGVSDKEPLEVLLKRAVDAFNALPPEEQERQRKVQREGCVRAEMAMGDEGTRVVSPSDASGTWRPTSDATGAAPTTVRSYSMPLSTRPADAGAPDWTSVTQAAWDENNPADADKGVDAGLEVVAYRWKGFDSHFVVNPDQPRPYSAEPLVTLASAAAALEDAAVRERELREKMDPQNWKDRDDEWSGAIKAVHPCNSDDPDRFKLFDTALEMVGNRHGKYELVGLVQWLLTRATRAEARAADLLKALERARDALKERGPISAFDDANEAILAATQQQDAGKGVGDA